MKTRNLIEDIITGFVMMIFVVIMAFLFMGCGPYPPERSKEEIHNEYLQQLVDSVECKWSQKNQLCICIRRYKIGHWGYEGTSIAIDTLGRSCNRNL